MILWYGENAKVLQNHGFQWISFVALCGFAVAQNHEKSRFGILVKKNVETHKNCWRKAEPKTLTRGANTCFPFSSEICTG